MILEEFGKGIIKLSFAVALLALIGGTAAFAPRPALASRKSPSMLSLGTPAARARLVRVGIAGAAVGGALLVARRLYVTRRRAAATATAEAISEAILPFDDRGMITLSHKVYGLRTASSTAADAILRLPVAPDGGRGVALVVSGFCIKKAMAAETDGPPGAVAVGEALSRLGFEVYYVTDEYSSVVMRATAALGSTAACPVIEFPVTPAAATVPYAKDDSARDFAARLLRERAPALLVAVERAGRGADGAYRNIRGEPFDQLNARADYLFDLKDSATLSVGVADGGNEIGCGRFLAEGALPVLRDGVVVTSTPAVTRTDHTIVASVSNWGAFGLCASLAVGARDSALLPTPSHGEALLAAGVAVGAVDGLRHKCEMYVDGRPGEEAPLETLGSIVTAALNA